MVLCAMRRKRTVEQVLVRSSRSGRRAGRWPDIRRGEENTMIDYISSKIAHDEHVNRVRLLMPIEEHEARLREERLLDTPAILRGIPVQAEDRRDLPVTQQIGQMLGGLVHKFATAGDW